MAVYWNFREILGVYPDAADFTCVGTNQTGPKARRGQPCQIGHKFSNDSRHEAARLLNSMDRCKTYQTCYHYLGELAFLTLCPQSHRKKQSQIDEVTRRYQQALEIYESTRHNEAIEAVKLRSDRLLMKMKTMEKVLMEEQVEEKKYEVWLLRSSRT
jgi:hypothetical protein